jgi:hypothetical protein
MRSNSYLNNFEHGNDPVIEYKTWFIGANIDWLQESFIRVSDWWINLD